MDRPTWGGTVTPNAAFEAIRLLPADGGVHAWRVLRAVALWISGGCAGSPPFDARGIRTLEERILTAGYDDEIRLPLAVIARSLAPDADDAEVERLAYACLCVADWALGRRLYGLAASFATAASLAAGSEPYAAVAARLRGAVARR